MSKSKNNINLQIPIEDTKLFSSGICNALGRGEIYTLSDLTHLSQSNLRSIRCIGPKRYEEILNKLQSLGLQLQEEDEKAVTNKHIKEIQNQLKELKHYEFLLKKYSKIKKPKKKLNEEIEKSREKLKEVKEVGKIYEKK